jgi:hypothetical protein
MKILKTNIFLIVFFFILSGCAQKEEEDSVDPISPPGQLSYEVQELNIEKNKPLNFMNPIVTGESLRFKISPALPLGLYLNSYLGTLSGIPKESILSTVFTITAYNDSGENSFQIKITVTERPIPEIDYSLSRYELPLGQELTSPILLNKFGATYTSFSIDKPLPTGLSFNITDGSVSGTPTSFIPNSLHTVKGVTSTGTEIYTSLLIQILDSPPVDLIFNQGGFERTSFIQNREEVIIPIIPSLNGGLVELYSISPELPAGLSFNSLNGVISGTPTLMLLSTKYTITASNSGGSVSKDIFIEVKNIPPSNLTYNHITISLRKTIPISNPYKPTYNGGDISLFNISPSLPSGLLFNTINGEISGTPVNVSPITVYTVTGGNNGGDVSTTFNLFVKDLPPQNLSYPIVSEIYVKNTPITSLQPSFSGGSILSFSINPALPLGMTLNQSTGEISGVPLEISQITSYIVRAINSEGQAPYAFFIAVKDEAPTNLTYSVQNLVLEKGTTIASINPTNQKGAITSYSMSIDLPLGLQLNTVTGEISGTPTSVVSEDVYRVTGRNATGEVTVDLRILVNDKPPLDLNYGVNNYLFDRGVPIPELIPSSMGGDIISYRVRVGETLPSGLNLDTNSGIISGVPGTRILSSSTIIEGVNSGGVIAVQINFEVNDYPPENLSYGNSTIILTLGQDLGSEGIFPSNDGGDVVTYSVSPQLPQGLTLDSITGSIKGTPENPNGGTSSDPIGNVNLPNEAPYSTQKTFTVSAFNSGGVTTKDIGIRIVPPKPIISLPNDIIIQKDSVLTGYLPTVTGGSALEFLIQPTNLPLGLSFNSVTGEISGTPTQVTPSQDYIIRARNDGGDSSAEISIRITEIPPSAISYNNYKTDFFGDINHFIESNNWYWNGLLIGTSSSTTLSSDGFLYTKGNIFNGIKSEIKRIYVADNEFIISKYLDDSVATYPPIKIIPVVSGGSVTLWEIDKELPEGLLFNNVDGSISGVPIEGTPVTIYNITATNEGGSSSKQLSLKIKDLPPANLTYGLSSYEFDSSELIVISAPTYTGGSIIDFSISPNLPTGLILDTSIGSVSKPEGVNVQALALTMYTVQGCNNEGCSTASFSLRINPNRPENISYGDENFLEEDVIHFTIGDNSGYLPDYEGGLANSFVLGGLTKIFPLSGFSTERFTVTTVEDFEALFTSEVESGGLSSIGLNFNTTSGQISGNISSYPSHYFYTMPIQGVNDSPDASEAAVTFIYINRKPISNAGSDFDGTIFNTITLDGTNSSDPDSLLDWFFMESTRGKQLNYSWRVISKPVGSSIVTGSLSNSSIAQPTFIPDSLGFYDIGLTINDGLSNSQNEDVVRVYVKDVPPNNLSYGTQSSGLGPNIFMYHLDGSTVINLTPSNSGGTIVNYSINPALPLGLSLDSSTGQISGLPQLAIVPTDFTITASNTGGSTSKVIKLFINRKPIANATAPEKNVYGSQITLNGTGSLDPDGNFLESSPYNFENKYLTYTWTIKSKPIGSVITEASFVSRYTATPKITPDLKGDYVFSLFVFDGYLLSETIDVTISVGSPPSNISFSDNGSILATGSNFVYNINDPISISILFDGDSTSEQDLSVTFSGLPLGLTYNSNNKRIEGNIASSLSPSSFTVFISNKGGSASSSFTIWVNSVPIVNVLNPLVIDNAIGSPVFGDASSTIDTDLNLINSAPYNSLTSFYEWSIIGLPATSTLQDSNILNNTTDNISFVNDVAGSYILSARFFDGLIFSDNYETIQRDTVGIESIDRQPVARVKFSSINTTPSETAEDSNNLTFSALNDIVLLKAVGSEVFKGSISYLWEVVSTPDLSLSTILNPNLQEASFILDEEGTYQFRLTISDGTDSSTIYLFTNFIGSSELDFDIDSNFMLTKDNSPYLLTQDININNNSTLSIESGVVVYGQGHSININNGSFISNSINSKIYLDNINITNSVGANSIIDIRGNYTKDLSICSFIQGTTSECSGSIIIQDNLFYNLKGDQRISTSTSDINILRNIFIDSNGFSITGNGSNVIVSENYVYNSLGGETGLSDKFFINVKQNISERIRVDKNRFINPNEYSIIKNVDISNQRLYLKYNFWNESFDLESIKTRINYPDKALVTPFLTSPFDTIPDGRPFL